MSVNMRMDFLFQRVDAILKLLALQVASGRRTVEAIHLLNRAGLDPRLIAEVCNTTLDVVRVRISEGKKKSRTKRKSHGRPSRQGLP